MQDKLNKARDCSSRSQTNEVDGFTDRNLDSEHSKSIASIMFDRVKHNDSERDIRDVLKERTDVPDQKTFLHASSGNKCFQRTMEDDISSLPPIPRFRKKHAAAADSIRFVTVENSDSLASSISSRMQLQQNDLSVDINQLPAEETQNSESAVCSNLNTSDEEQCGSVGASNAEAVASRRPEIDVNVSRSFEESTEFSHQLTRPLLHHQLTSHRSPEVLSHSVSDLTSFYDRHTDQSSSLLLRPQEGENMVNVARDRHTVLPVDSTKHALDLKVGSATEFSSLDVSRITSNDDRPSDSHHLENLYRYHDDGMHNILNKYPQGFEYHPLPSYAHNRHPVRSSYYSQSSSIDYSPMPLHPSHHQFGMPPPLGFTLESTYLPAYHQPPGRYVFVPFGNPAPRSSADIDDEKSVPLQYSHQENSMMHCSTAGPSFMQQSPPIVSLPKPSSSPPPTSGSIGRWAKGQEENLPRVQHILRDYCGKAQRPGTWESGLRSASALDLPLSSAPYKPTKRIDTRPPCVPSAPLMEQASLSPQPMSFTNFVTDYRLAEPQSPTLALNSESPGKQWPNSYMPMLHNTTIGTTSVDNDDNASSIVDVQAHDGSSASPIDVGVAEDSALGSDPFLLTHSTELLHVSRSLPSYQENDYAALLNEHLDTHVYSSSSAMSPSKFQASDAEISPAKYSVTEDVSSVKYQVAVDSSTKFVTADDMGMQKYPQKSESSPKFIGSASVGLVEQMPRKFLLGDSASAEEYCRTEEGSDDAISEGPTVALHHLPLSMSSVISSSGASDECGPKQAPKPLRKRQGNRLFQCGWLHEFSWLRYDDKLKLYFCHFCQLMDNDSSFGKGRSLPYPKKDVFIKHEATELHGEASEKFDRMVAAKPPLTSWRGNGGGVQGSGAMVNVVSDLLDHMTGHEGAEDAAGVARTAQRQEEGNLEDELYKMVVQANSSGSSLAIDDPNSPLDGRKRSAGSVEELPQLPSDLKDLGTLDINKESATFPLCLESSRTAPLSVDVSHVLQAASTSSPVISNGLMVHPVHPAQPLSPIMGLKSSSLSSVHGRPVSGTFTSPTSSVEYLDGPRQSQQSSTTAATCEPMNLALSLSTQTSQAVVISKGGPESKSAPELCATVGSGACPNSPAMTKSISIEKRQKTVTATVPVVPLAQIPKSYQVPGTSVYTFKLPKNETILPLQVIQTSGTSTLQLVSTAALTKTTSLQIPAAMSPKSLPVPKQLIDVLKKIPAATNEPMVPVEMVRCTDNFGRVSYRFKEPDKRKDGVLMVNKKNSVNGVRRNIRKQWFLDFPWLEWNRLEGKLYCVWCRKYGQSSQFTSGRPAIQPRRFNLSKHEQTDMHKQSAEKERQELLEMGRDILLLPHEASSSSSNADSVSSVHVSELPTRAASPSCSSVSLTEKPREVAAKRPSAKRKRKLDGPEAAEVQLDEVRDAPCEAAKQSSKTWISGYPWLQFAANCSSLFCIACRDHGVKGPLSSGILYAELTQDQCESHASMWSHLNAIKKYVIDHPEMLCIGPETGSIAADSKGAACSGGEVSELLPAEQLRSCIMPDTPLSPSQHSAGTSVCGSVAALQSTGCRSDVSMLMQSGVIDSTTKPNPGFLSIASHMQQKEMLCDIWLKAGGKRFPAHRFVLVCSSDYFKTRVKALESEYDFPGVTADGMSGLLDFMYGRIARFEGTSGDLLQLYRAACTLFVKAAKKELAQLLLNQKLGTGSSTSFSAIVDHKEFGCSIPLSPTEPALADIPTVALVATGTAAIEQASVGPLGHHTSSQAFLPAPATAKGAASPFQHSNPGHDSPTSSDRAESYSSAGSPLPRGFCGSKSDSESISSSLSKQDSAVSSSSASSLSMVLRSREPLSSRHDSISSECSRPGLLSSASNDDSQSRADMSFGSMSDSSQATASDNSSASGLETAKLRVTDADNVSESPGKTAEKKGPAAPKKEKENSGYKTGQKQLMKDVLPKCRFCTKIYLRGSFLEKHEKSCSSVYCKPCDKVFDSEEDLKSHATSQHGSELTKKEDKRVQCDICKMVCYRKSYLMEHMQSHRNLKSYKCDVCGRGFNRKRLLVEHEYIHKDDNMRPHKCQVCGKGFFKLFDRRRHFVALHSGCKPFSCTQCNQTFAWARSLRDHMRSKHDEGGSNRDHRCTECDMTFHRAYHLKRHLVTHSKEKSFVCEWCGSGFSQNASYNKHKKHSCKMHPEPSKKTPLPTQKTSLTCQVCGQSFLQRSLLENHVKKECPIKANGVDEVVVEASAENEQENPIDAELSQQDFESGMQQMMNLLK